MANPSTATALTLVESSEKPFSKEDAPIIYLNLESGYCPICKKNVRFSRGVVRDKTAGETSSVWECIRCETRQFDSPPVNR